MIDFSDIENDLPFDSTDSVAKTPITKEGILKLFMQPCRKCNGRKNFYSYSGRVIGPCFTCKGTGQQSFKTSSEQRQKAKASAEARKERDQQQAWADFQTQHPEIAAWIQSSKDSFPFAASLEQAVIRWGHLTDKQLASAQKCVNGRKAAQEARSATISAAPEVTLESVEKAFQTAKSAGIKYPKLNLDVFKFSPAPDSGKNAGAIYVKEGEAYLGKVMGGKFIRTRDCTDEQQCKIIAVAADPKAAAIAYGKRFGSCAICRRELSNQASIDLGIGPICAEKFGW